MKIIESRVYRGPNQWAHFPVIQLTLDLGPLEEWPSATLPGFVDKLIAALPSLHEHGCSYGKSGGFIRRMREEQGTWLGHVLEHVAIEIQNQTGAHVTFGKTRSLSGQHGVYRVVYEYDEARCGEEAGEVAYQLLLSLLPPERKAELDPALFDPAFNFQAEVERLIRLTQRRALGPSTASLVRAAEARNIPWLRLNDQSLIQFGYGKYQKRIQATVTSETRHIAVEIASDKEQTNQILASLGIPVPKQELIYSAEAAVEAAEDIGYPVVVKPLDANHGRGVSINLTTPEQVMTAFTAAVEHNDAVIVESFITGEDHRMLVVNNQLVAVAKRVPGHVVGDGVHTVAQLVDIVNADPNRGIGHEKILTRLVIDHQAERMMEQAGVTLASVIPRGEVLFLRSTGNLSTGGTSIDVTDVVHPDNREMAVRAVMAVGLDVGGVDFLCPDITRSYREVGGGICEINAAPGFRMHVAPTQGTPRDVAGPVIDMLFPPGSPSRIPIAAVTGTNGKTTTTRMLSHILKNSGRTVGMTTTDGVYIDARRVLEGDMTGPMGAQVVLRDPTVDVAVLETARGGLLRAGLGYPYTDVSACLNVSEDHLGLNGINTVEQLAHVKRIIIEVAREAAFLNADDALCLRMADHSEAKAIWYVTQSPTHALVREHIRSGGGAVVLEAGVNGQMISLYHGGAQMPLLWTHLIPATLEGRAMHNVQNAMFAAGMAYVMGIKLDDIRHGLRTFDATFFQAPGRMNIYDQHPFRVILDYGHNPAAVRAMVQVVNSLDVKGRKLCVLSMPGDRRDIDIQNVARLVASTFDQFFCHQDDNLRGRASGEVPDLLYKYLIEADVPSSHILIIPDEVSAVDAALGAAQMGDLVLIFADHITRTWKQITKFRVDGDGPPTATFTSKMHVPVSYYSPALTDQDLGTSGGRADIIHDERGVRISSRQED
jgi:cyanophycin synthetase